MQVRFVGPLGVVTGSCSWLEHEGLEFLVDCGLEQDERPTAGWNHQPWPFEPARLQFVILTHAHADHCGLIPVLYRRGFKGRVWCTKETAEIADAMLRDSARLSNGLYNTKDVDAIQWQEPARPVFGKYHPVAHDLFIQFFRAAHVMGAVSVCVLWGDRTVGEQKSITFSGDLGPDTEDQECLPFLRHRMNVPRSDFAVIESTYGSKARDPSQYGLEARRSHLKDLLDQIAETRGTLLIPAFSLGRAQDLLFDLHWLVAQDPGRYGAVAFRLDAPLAVKLAPIIARGLERTEPNGKGKVRPLWLGKQLFRWLGLDDTEPQDCDRAIDICRITLGLPATYPASADRGNEIARGWPYLLRTRTDRTGRTTPEEGGKRPEVIIATSGMGDHGRSASWLRRLLRDSDSVIAFSGYCAASSVGGKLQTLATSPLSERRRSREQLSWNDGTSIPEREIMATISALPGYSAHADQAGLVAWTISRFKGEMYPAGRTVFIQHGNEQERKALARVIEQTGHEHGIEVHCVRPMTADKVYVLDDEAVVA